MIGIYQGSDYLQMTRQLADGSWSIFEKELEEGDLSFVELQKVFAEAQDVLGFSTRDDFRLCVDFPKAHCIVQTVPFAGKQLDVVLENFLEEELPEDIEDFFFDYKVLGSTGQNTSILGFWIHRDLLKNWTDLAEELSLNALDIQPAESSLFPDQSAAAHLNMRLDHQGQLRYSAFVNQGGEDRLTLGKLTFEGIEPGRAQQVLGFSGIDWSKVPELRVSKSVDAFARDLAPQLGIENVHVSEEDEDAEKYFFVRAAAKADVESESHHQFNYRRGEYAQRGISEKIMVPVTALCMAIVVLVATYAWYNQLEVKREEAYVKNIKRTQQKVWKELFPEKPIPHYKKIYADSLDLLQQMTVSDDGDGASISAMQKLGLLFKFVRTDDNLQINNIAITSRGINISGLADEASMIDALDQGFASQQDFEKPSIRRTKKDSKFIFRLSTKLKQKE